MAKRSRSGRPRRVPSKVRKARKLVGEAFRRKGKQATEAQKEIQKRVRSEMTRFVSERFIAVPTKARARSIQARMSLAGVARRVASSEARAEYTRDRLGRFHRADGRIVSKANMKRSMAMRSYWNQVRIIGAALEIKTGEARKAYTLAGGEKGWQDFVGYPGK